LFGLDPSKMTGSWSFSVSYPAFFDTAGVTA
jgi:hypothetical protein